MFKLDFSLVKNTHLQWFSHLAPSPPSVFSSESIRLCSCLFNSATDTLLNVFLAIAVDNLANAQELTKVHRKNVYFVTSLKHFCLGKYL